MFRIGDVNASAIYVQCKKIDRQSRGEAPMAHEEIIYSGPKEEGLPLLWGLGS